MAGAARRPHLHDVIIVGAGPAGLAAAETLAGRGHDVLILEEHSVVGQPVHCTGLLGLDAFSEFDLPRETILGTAGAARFLSAGLQSVLVESDHIRAAVIDRGAFDHALAQRALGAGGTMATGVRVERIEPARDHLLLHLSQERAPLRARACILACGANYRFHRLLGLGIPRAFAQSVQTEAPFPSVSHVQVHFGRELAPGGFAWVVPFTCRNQSYARLGLTCDRRAIHRFSGFLQRLASELNVDLREAPPARPKILPLGPIRKTYAPRLLAVGDAAGLVKPTTGGGIYYSLISGRLAAETLDEALRRDVLTENALQVYETRWRQRLGPEIRAGLVFRAVATRLDDRAIDALIELARVDGIIPLLRREANFNWHRSAALALLRNTSFRRIVLSSLWRGKKLPSPLTDSPYSCG